MFPRCRQQCGLIALAARSQIMDTDYAQETMKMNRAMVLQQASLGALQMYATMQNSILALLGN